MDPLTSLPNVASISHLIEVLSTQYSTLMTESHVAHRHTFKQRTSWHAMRECIVQFFLDYFGFD